jgi:hypothetical protein
MLERAKNLLTGDLAKEDRVPVLDSGDPDRVGAEQMRVVEQAREKAQWPNEPMAREKDMGHDSEAVGIGKKEEGRSWTSWIRGKGS